jgi:hypothetical protein
VVSQAGSGHFLLIICSTHSFLILLFAYVGIVESNMDFRVEKLMNFAVLGNGVWSLLTLVQVKLD